MSLMTMYLSFKVPERYKNLPPYKDIKHENRRTYCGTFNIILHLNMSKCISYDIIYKIEGKAFNMYLKINMLIMKPVYDYNAN